VRAILRSFLGGLILSVMFVAIYHSAEATCEEPDFSIQANDNRTRQKSKFTITVVSNGITKSGATFTQNTYVAETGEKVYEVTVHCESSEAARKELEFWIDRATKIIKREKQGKDLTEEAAISVLPSKHCDDETMIMETEGKLLYTIHSCSAQVLTDFQKESREERETGTSHNQ
jgi:hypothetical protein